MRRLPGRLLMTLVAAALSAACSVSGPRPSAPAGVAAPPSRIALPASPLSEEQQIVHVLNRLAYGPRPGDVERVSQMGLAAWIERQLDPAQIPDPAVERALSAYPVLTMTAADLLREYPRPNQQLVQKVKSGEMGRKEMMDAFPPERRPFVIIAQMQSAKVLRAVMSERQLQEVMVDFWFNHLTGVLL